MVSCVAYNCKTRSDLPSCHGLGMFTFPKDKRRRKIWAQKVKIQNFVPSKHSRLCSRHFDFDQFVIDPRIASSVKFTVTKKRLKPNAIPTIFDYGKPNEKKSPDERREKRISRAVEKRNRLEVLNLLNIPISNKTKQKQDRTEEKKDGTIKDMADPAEETVSSEPSQTDVSLAVMTDRTEVFHADTQTELKLPVSPAYLHGNSTSHTFAFSAVAEILDNAYDPDVNASEIWIDKRIINEKTCMTFVDNGNGMDPNKLQKMLSFGYCEKVAVGSHQPIGHYGNGFKSGSMRLGQDALVFTRKEHTMSVGLLSQTYLKNIKAETVLVPIVSWSLPDKMRSNTGDVKSNLLAILQHSIIKTERDLLHELDAMEKLKTGTKILIYNLTKTANGNLELDFTSDPADIRNPDTHVMDYSTINRMQSESKPKYRVSLRDYCSILYLKPRMKIVLRGRKVKTKLIQKCLSQTETDTYRPTWAERPIPIRFGFISCKNEQDYGIMMYHKNRLIRAYEKVGYQKQPNDLGIGVVGVVDAYFLTPIHNKQDFQRDDKWSAFMSNVAAKLNDYWNEKRGGIEKRVTPEFQVTVPDWTWAQCDNCLQWRRLTSGMRSEDLPDKWFCHMNSDAQFNRCDIPEEPEDEDEALSGATYKKTFKKQQQEKRNRIKIMEEQQNRAREMVLAAKEKELIKKEQEIKKKASTDTEVSSTAGSLPSNVNQMTPVQLRRMKKNLDTLTKEKATKEKEIAELKRQKAMSERICREYQKVARNLNLDSLITKVNKQIEEESVSSTSGTIQIKTEDGDLVDIIPVDDASGSGVDANNHSKIKTLKRDIVDLTVDSDGEDSPTQAKQSKTDDNDVKPDISKIKIEPNQEKPKQSCVNRHTQTDKDSTEVVLVKKRLHDFQINVHKLLKMIVPDEDLGPPESVEDIVTAMIKHNS